MGIQIFRDLPDGEVPLYVTYPGQLQPQPAYLSLDERGRVRLGCDGEIGNAATSDVRHGRRLRWRVSPRISREAAMALLADPQVIGLLESVHAGRIVYWDGHRYAGRLSADADEASTSLGKYIYRHYGPESDADAEVWDADDWLSGAGQSLDDNWPPEVPLDEAVRGLEAEANADGVVLVGWVGDALLEKLTRGADDGGELTGEWFLTYKRNSDD